MRDIWTEKGRDPKRIREMCDMLRDAWEKVPDQRLGQFLLNYVFAQGLIKDSVPELEDELRGHYPDYTNAGMFNQEDDETHRILYSLSKDSISFVHKKEERENNE